MKQEKILSRIKDPKTYKVDLRAFKDLFQQLEKSNIDETLFKAVPRRTQETSEQQDST